MKQFCQDHSVNLFNILVDSITRADGRPTSKNHTHLQEQRVVGLLHTLAYFRYFNPTLWKHLIITVHQHFSLHEYDFFAVSAQIKLIYDYIKFMAWYSNSIRSQKTSHLQKQAGMFLSMHGLTRSAQTAGRVLGFSTGTRLNDAFKQQQAKSHKELMDKTVETAHQVK